MAQLCKLTAEATERLCEAFDGLKQPKLKNRWERIAAACKEIARIEHEAQSRTGAHRRVVQRCYGSRRGLVQTADASSHRDCGGRDCYSANADTIQIANKLFVSPALRDSMVAAPRKRAAGPRPITIEYTDPDNPKPSPPANGSASNANDSGDITSTQRQLLGQFSGWTEEFRRFNRMAMKTPAGKTAYACIAESSRTDECKDAKRRADDLGDGFPGFRFISEAATTSSWLMWLIPQHLAGWILSAIAVSLGAPFWFDTLNRFTNIRSTGKSPAKKAKGVEKKADDTEDPFSGRSVARDHAAVVQCWRAGAQKRVYRKI